MDLMKEELSHKRSFVGSMCFEFFTDDSRRSVGCHLGDVAKVYFGAAYVFTNRLKALKMCQNCHPHRLCGKINTRTIYG